MCIEMPIYPSHHDPEFFPDPEEFWPDRFLKENASNITPFTYRPFGGIYYVPYLSLGNNEMQNPRTFRWSTSMRRPEVRPEQGQDVDGQAPAQIPPSAHREDEAEAQGGSAHCPQLSGAGGQDREEKAKILKDRKKKRKRSTRLGYNSC